MRRLTVDGCVATELSLDLDALRTLPSREVVTTMECAGNGRAHLTPRASLVNPKVVGSASKRVGNFERNPQYGVLLEQLWVR